MTSFHNPKTYSETTAVIRVGHHFHTTPHGLRGEVFRAPVCGTDDKMADTVFYGWRDAFSSDAIARIRETQERRRGLYLSEPGRPVHLPSDIAYAIAYKGQMMGFVTVGRQVVLNEPMATANRGTRNAYAKVASSLQALAAREDSHLFSTDPS